VTNVIGGIESDFKKLADPKKADLVLRYFKTGKGEYGAGDVFLGLKVPQIRQLVKKYRGLSLSGVDHFLQSSVHEHRLFAVLVLSEQFKRDDPDLRRAIYQLYLKRKRFVNNWDIVDSSAPYIVGAYLKTRSRAPLVALAKSKNLWDRRIAIIATQNFIRAGEFDDTLKIAKILLGDKQDLIHKATGWMIREVYQRDPAKAEKFLKQNIRRVPRTTLRYAIEKMSLAKRKAYLAM
jgi:3-methyladenine DNA glycosylase AlkD